MHLPTLTLAPGLAPATDSTIYYSYTHIHDPRDSGGHGDSGDFLYGLPFFAVLGSRAEFEQAARDARDAGLGVTRLQTRAEGPDASPIAILCISDRALHAGEESRILEAVRDFVRAAVPHADGEAFA